MISKKNECNDWDIQIKYLQLDFPLQKNQHYKALHYSMLRVIEREACVPTFAEG